VFRGPFVEHHHMTAEGICKIHIAVLVNVPVLPRMKGVGVHSVDGFSQIHRNAHPVVLCRLRDQDPAAARAALVTWVEALNRLWQPATKARPAS
jgi:hypothetical protein